MDPKVNLGCISASGISVSEPQTLRKWSKDSDHKTWGVRRFSNQAKSILAHCMDRRDKSSFVCPSVGAWILYHRNADSPLATLVECNTQDVSSGKRK